MSDKEKKEKKRSEEDFEEYWGWEPSNITITLPDGRTLPLDEYIKEYEKEKEKNGS